VNGDSSESKVVLQAQGISGTLFEKGNWHNYARQSHET
jgi:hypothetical protein